MNTTTALRNINLLTETKYSEIENIKEDELYAIETEIYHDADGNWYRVYPDGWCEQGGHIEETSTNIIEINFLKPFMEIPTLLTSVGSSSRTSVLDNGIDVYNLSTTGFTKQYIANVGTGWSWMACGYIALTIEEVPDAGGDLTE